MKTFAVFLFVIMTTFATTSAQGLVVADLIRQEVEQITVIKRPEPEMSDFVKRIVSWGKCELAPLKKLSDFGLQKAEKTPPVEILVSEQGQSIEEFWKDRTPPAKIATMLRGGAQIPALRGEINL